MLVLKLMNNIYKQRLKIFFFHQRRDKVSFLLHQCIDDGEGEKGIHRGSFFLSML